MDTVSTPVQVDSPSLANSPCVSPVATPEEHTEEVSQDSSVDSGLGSSMVSTSTDHSSVITTLIAATRNFNNINPEFLNLYRLNSESLTHIWNLCYPYKVVQGYPLVVEEWMKEFTEFHVVIHGRQSGVFIDRNTADRQINNFSSAEYRSFPTPELALKHWREACLTDRVVRQPYENSLFHKVVRIDELIKRTVHVRVVDAIVCSRESKGIYNHHMPAPSPLPSSRIRVVTMVNQAPINEFQVFPDPPPVRLPHGSSANLPYDTGNAAEESSVRAVHSTSPTPSDSTDGIDPDEDDFVSSDYQRGPAFVVIIGRWPGVYHTIPQWEYAMHGARHAWGWPCETIGEAIEAFLSFRSEVRIAV